MINIKKFHIHGDNIVECERTLDLIIRAFDDSIESVKGPNGSLACPEYFLDFKNCDDVFHFTFFPGFGRWNEDILTLIKESGGVLREAADAIITRVDSGYDVPVLAIEYCGALPAGNQAWQRSGRAYSFGLTKVPFLYVSELGGYELDSQRNRRLPRMPNPAVPFSYLSFSIEQDTPILPIFITSPGANESSKAQYKDEFADEELLKIIKNIISGLPSESEFKSVIDKVLSFVRKQSKLTKGRTTLTPQEWDSAYSKIKNGRSFVDFLVSNTRLSWSKTVYIDSLTESAKLIMDEASKIGIGLTSTRLPMCIIENNKRKAFASSLKVVHNKLSEEFIKWLERDGHLVICWIMGFKPAGDDARPDRGLAPLARMLIGNDCDLLSVIYGPAPDSTWPLLESNPKELIRRNGLWESILNISDAILVDSSTDLVTNHGFLRSHWYKDAKEKQITKILVEPKPVAFGENDVDTVLHTIFSRFGGSNVFEGMCNPPGGDWSGVSLLLKEKAMEYRWLSLPRVSGSDTKRPDHLFQLFGLAPKPIILSIESKEKASSVEKDIGLKLSKYISNLLITPASIERSEDSLSWKHSRMNLDPGDYIFVSAVAFIETDPSQISSVAKKSKADIVFTFSFDKNQVCNLKMYSSSKIGKILIKHIKNLKFDSEIKLNLI